jgi:2-dehydro-3-deoxyphosphogluconate aldolase / (4S)-4-hydroxy-2-oxoglutarate aldolase
MATTGRYASRVTDTTPRPAIPSGLVEGGVVAIARRVSAATAPTIAAALADGGVRAFEITLNDPETEALRAVEAVARAGVGGAHGPLAIGAGTILSLDAAERAVAAGATFLVMPHTDPAIVAWAAERGIPALPGAATPTEVLAGWRAGASAIKVFPASSLGASFVRELRGPLPDIPFVPTGGVSAANAGEFIAAGAIAVGLGSWLVGDGERPGVTERARQVADAVLEARAGGGRAPQPGRAA